MNIKVDSILVCGDCLPVIVNGDYTSLDYYYTPEESIIRQNSIDTGIANLQNEYKGRLVCNYDSETGDGIEEFSHSRCECCDTRLAGSRYRMAIIG